MKSKEKNSTGVILTVAAIFLLAAVLIVMILLLNQMRATSGYAPSVTDAGNTGRVSYATEGVTIIDDEDELQRRVNAMYSDTTPGVGLKYQNDAYSSDGENFGCMIGNSDLNELDAYFTICADAEMTDVLYVSGLLRPGQAFEKIKLEHPLEKGDHRVYVGVSLVEEIDGQQTIVNTVAHTMDFHVT